MIMSADRAMTDFLRSRNPDRVMRERFNPPMAHVASRLYDDITDQLRAALDGGSYMQLKLACLAATEHAGAGSARKGAA